MYITREQKMIKALLNQIALYTLVISTLSGKLLLCELFLYAVLHGKNIFKSNGFYQWLLRIVILFFKYEYCVQFMLNNVTFIP